MFILFGSTGFVGSAIAEELSSRHIPYMGCKVRTYDHYNVELLLDTYKPTHVINAAGAPTDNTVDHFECRDNRDQMIMSNTVGVLILASLCKKKGIHYSVIMSGCIFEGGTFDTTDTPNFTGSQYSLNRVRTEQLLECYDVMVARIRMPISDKSSSKCLVEKARKYETLNSVQNSVTYLPEMATALLHLALKNRTGVFHLVNRGTTSMWDISKLFNMSNKIQSADCNKFSVAPRSNAILYQSDEIYPYMNPIDEVLAYLVDRK